MGYRVVEWSTGDATSAAIRGILHHPDVELVGVWGNPATAPGPAATDLAALEATGITVTQDTEALLALIPDCVLYTATAAQRPEVLDDLLAILRSGANVVAPSTHLLFHPPAAEAELAEVLDATAHEAAASFFAPGGDRLPGANDLMLLVDAIPHVCRARPGVLAPSDIWPGDAPGAGTD